MASEVKTNKVSPATGSATEVTGLNVGSDAAGDVLYHDGTNYTRLAKPGTPADEVLTFATSATAPSWVAPASGGLIRYTVYTGDHTWLKSANSPTKVVVEVQGSGGGGGGAYNGYSVSGGTGGVGGYCRKFIDVSSVTQALIVVGAAGTAGAHAGSGGAGNTSSWIDTASGGSSTITASGGGLGVGGGAAGHGAGGAGGAASGGDINIAGPNGSTNVAGPKPTAGSMYGFYNPTTTQAQPVTGLAGTGYGSPGAGGTGNGVAAGGAGAIGLVIVWEYA